MTDTFIDQIGRICESATDYTKAAQQVCAALREGVKHYTWVGIYMLDATRETLLLEAWDGPAPTQHVKIGLGEGICGLAAREGKTIIVPDVRKDPRYLECFLATRAEIVVPIMHDGRVLGEIDIDSDLTAAFGETDQFFLEWCADRLARLFTCHGKPRPAV